MVLGSYPIYSSTVAHVTSSHSIPTPQQDPYCVGFYFSPLLRSGINIGISIVILMYWKM